MPAIEIIQDHEVDEDGEVGSRLACFWTEGHGHDVANFVHAVVDHCLDYGEPVNVDPDAVREMWQYDRKSGDSVTYERGQAIPEGSPWRMWRPITVVDMERHRRGNPRCSVKDCDRPWQAGTPVRVAVDESDFDDYTAVEMRFCAEHRAKFPEPYYRTLLVPVGATLTLPSDAP